jgi:hypothetical protein
MLFPQIPRDIRDRITAELRVNLKLLSATFSEKANQDSLFSQVDVLAKYITGHEEVGTVDAPAAYIAGVMDLAWGPFEAFGREGSNIAYFGGTTAETILGLGGSTRNLIGVQPGPSDQLGGYSSAPHLIDALSDAMDADSPDAESSTRRAQSLERSREVVRDTSLSMLSRYPKQQLAFLAKTLMAGRVSPKGLPSTDWDAVGQTRYVLGSPIYVAFPGSQPERPARRFWQVWRR